MGTEQGPAPTGGDRFDQVTVELSPGEAAVGTMRAVTVPPGDHTITVQLPAGLQDGAQLRLPGAGRPDPSGGPAGDLVLDIRVGHQSGFAPPAFSDPYAAGPYSAGPYSAGPAPTAAYPVTGFPGGQMPPAPGAPVSGVPVSGAQPPYPGGPGGMPPYPVGGYPPVAQYPQGFLPPPRKKGRGKLIAGISGALALVLLVACCGGAWLIGDDEKKKTDPKAGTAISASPTPTAAQAVAPEQYRAALASFDTKLTTALKQLAGAKTPTTAKAAAAALSAAADSANEELSAMVPPATVATAHTELLTALAELSSAAGDTESAASDRQVCTGSSATALLSRAAALDAVRSAAQRLTAADPAYKIGTGLPKKTKDTTRRAKNGNYIKRTSGGSGQLKIKNNGSTDSMISVVKKGQKKPVISVYVRAKGKYTVTGVRDGTYQVFMANGADWDAKGKRFTRNCGFSRFDDSFKFTTPTGQYTVWEITLTAVAGGNATSSGVDPDDFPG